MSLTNHNRIHDTSHTSHLPRGFFKKKKPPDEGDNVGSNNKNASINVNSFNLRCKFSENRVVNTNFFIMCIITSLLITVASGTGDYLSNSIEGAIATTTVGPRVLPVDGICQSIHIRFDLERITDLTGCRVVEGSVAILLLDEIRDRDIANISFPDLVEITGYLMLYRISGFTSLNQLFPNLAVIRGRELFKDYALIIYEMLELTEIGLNRLMEIERGNVRIEKNEKMCFVDTINWPKITTMSSGPYLEKNKLSLACPNCLSKCNPNGRNYCWNAEHCQNICPSACNSSCSPNGTCCDPMCMGGCSNDNLKQCVACRKFSLGSHPYTECVDKCPDEYYAYQNRRCLTQKECTSLNKPSLDGAASSETPYFTFNGSCLQDCPQGYSKNVSGSYTTCSICADKCLKRCQAKIIDSIATAQALKDCSIIDGPLEIQIRGTTKNQDGSNIVKELEASLINIIIIEDYLKVARSHPILSLSFLKNLRQINGRKLESNRNALVVWENQNLQELWDENQKITIGRGKLFFHFNPKLCFYKIEQLANKSTSAYKSRDLIENYDTAKLSNGDKTPCNVTPLNVTVVEVYPQAALLSWPPLKLDDDRSLLNYVVFYIVAPHQNVTLWDGRDACGNDGWSVEDVNSFSSTDTINQPLTKLEPYTQYAYYVKAYTLATEQKGAQSDIKYFTTKPDQPTRVRKIKASAIGHDKIEVSWETLHKVNGKLDHYILRAKAVDQNAIDRDYCKDREFSSQVPSSKDSHPIPPPPAQKDTPKILDTAPDGTCECKTCMKACSIDGRTPSEDIDDRQLANDFEDEIQDFVYIQTSEINTGDIPNEKSRAKRQIEFPDKPELDFPQQSSDREALKNSSDFYDDSITAEQTRFIISGLRHYTTYAITIRACRSLEPGEDLIQPTPILCSVDNSVYEQTFKQPSHDDILDFDVEAFTNGSSTDVKVTWTPPDNPNGLLLSYEIRYKRVDIEHASYQPKCLSHSMLNSTRSYLIRGLPPGNYSIDMRATSLAGNGNYTKAKFVYIKESSSNSMWYLFGTLLAVLIVGLMILAIVFKRMYLSSISSMKLIANVNPDYAGVTYKQDEWEIPRDKVTQLQELGQGSFGMVYEGIVNDLKLPGDVMRCAIKTVNESATDKERCSFLNEASVMKQFDTHHVVRLLGVVSRGQPTFVVMELMAGGDLKGYLRSHRPDYDVIVDPPQPPTLRQILQMAIEIADGMAYLSAKKFVHRDLAARNCMVAEDLTVKIGDFGMTRDIYETDYYRKGTKGLLPVRWMSPESLKDGVFSSSTDIFSYGVVLWEMATLASQPYQGLSNDQVLRYVIDGGVMERPENCPDKLYELMRRCWQHRPSARPTFFEIISILLDDVHPRFQAVSFYHSPQGQEIQHQMMQGELAVQITDDVTTPLRHDEDEEMSSIDAGNRFLMEEYKSDSLGDL